MLDSEIQKYAWYAENAQAHARTTIPWNITRISLCRWSKTAKLKAFLKASPFTPVLHALRVLKDVRARLNLQSLSMQFVLL